MNIIYFVPYITIAGGIFRIVSDKMNYLAENMEGRLFLAYYGNGQEKPIYPLHPNIQLLPIDIEWKVGFGKKINRVWKNISIIRHIFKKYKALTKSPLFMYEYYYDRENSASSNDVCNFYFNTPQHSSDSLTNKSN